VKQIISAPQGFRDTDFRLRQTPRRPRGAMRIFRSHMKTISPWIAGGASALAVAFAIAILCAAPAAAEHTRFWRQSDYDEFQKGTAKGLALRSDGEIVLAPKFAPLADANLAYLWSLRSDSHGNLYAAGGSNAKVIRLDGSGKATTVFESTEMTAQTMAIDKADNLYVGTSPDGKVYKVTPAGQKSVLFDPKTKYIWALELGPDGTLYVATGDTGKIFSVAASGKSELFFSGGETHILALALDGKGNLLAGTEPNGLVLRIPLAAPPAAAATAAKKVPDSADAGSARQAYVLYETAKKEITALVPDGAGNVYVAGIGEKPRPGAPQNPAQPQPQPPPANNNFETQNITVTVGGVQAPTQQATPTPYTPFPALTSSSVYRIAADGSPEEIWTAREDLVYSLALGADGKPLLGVGNQGAVIKLDGDHVFSRLAKTESEQVTGFARAANGKIYVATANPGKVFALGPGLESEGTLESQTFDAKIFSHWGRLTWWGENAGSANSSQNPPAANAARPPAAAVELYARAGNTSDPENSWSPWFGPYRNGTVAEIPPSRFVQWKAVLHGGSGPEPELSWVDVAYLPKNVAPRVGGVAVQNPGIRVVGFGGQQQGAPAQAVPAQLRQPPAVGAQPGAVSTLRAQGEPARFEVPPQGFVQKGYQAALWTAEDDNEDDLTYAIYYRGEGEHDWKLLKDKIEQRYYSWDTNSMPDGAYYLKIVGSDERSNVPDQALTGERESDRFVVDNTPPTVTGITAETTTTGSDPTVTLRFRATDATSAVVRAQYSLDAGEWILVRPAGDLSDSADERYTLTMRNLAPGEHTVSVRVYDQFENEAAAKSTFNVPAGKP
jgi:hypothetical protein